MSYPSRLKAKVKNVVLDVQETTTTKKDESVLLKSHWFLNDPHDFELVMLLFGEPCVRDHIITTPLGLEG